MPSGAAAGSWRCATPLLRFRARAHEMEMGYSIFRPTQLLNIRAGGSKDGMFTLESHNPIRLSAKIVF